MSMTKHQAHMFRSAKAISFCTTCRNRLWQLKETLPYNLAHLSANAEITLVDFGSTDGVADWVWSNFAEHIAAGRLTLFEVRGRVSWHMSRAKNLSHRLGRGSFLFNLDADNFLTPRDQDVIGESLRDKASCHQWTGRLGDGSHGRIGLDRATFFGIGGYDETMLPMGAQDVDILNRLKIAGKPVRRLSPPEREAIQNSHEQKMLEVGNSSTSSFGSDVNWQSLNDLNRALSRFRLAIDGPVRREGFQTFWGLLNKRSVIIDGFSIIREWTPPGSD